MGLFEIQVLDNDNNENITYADGMAGAIYGKYPPLHNALRPTGEFQIVDIVFRRPLFKDNVPIDPGYVTVFMNGVLIHDHVPLGELSGDSKNSRWGALHPVPNKGQLYLQDHGTPVRYRNIWYRPLPLRPLEGGTDGFTPPEFTKVKRKEIAESIRKQAASLKNEQNPRLQLIPLLTSLMYEKEDATYQTALSLALKYQAEVESFDSEKIIKSKDEIIETLRAIHFNIKYNGFPQDYPGYVILSKIAKENDWEKFAK